MPAFLEKKLKDQYGADSAAPYKIMNSIGAMHGNKTTAKGEAMQAKHDAKAKPKAKLNAYARRKASQRAQAETFVKGNK